MNTGNKNFRLYRDLVKRLGDLILALIGLILSSPFFIFTAIVLAWQNSGKVFFYQERPGRNTKPFRIIKFKTMNDRKDAEGKLLPDKERITRAGNIIRKLSIDEIPQLLNVLKGEMSLIGPRPLLFKYVPLYSKEQSRRHDVRPGITGWAQVNGRNSIPWTKKFEFDIYYVDNVSLFLDVKIIWLTIKKVIARDGVNQSDARPMEPFNGSN